MSREKAHHVASQTDGLTVIVENNLNFCQQLQGSTSQGESLIPPTTDGEMSQQDSTNQGESLRPPTTDCEMSQQDSTNQGESLRPPTDEMSLCGKCIMETFNFCLIGLDKFKYLLILGTFIYITAGSPVLLTVDKQAKGFANYLNLTGQGHTTALARLPGLFKQIGRELDYSKHYILMSDLAEGEWQEKLFEKIRDMSRLFEEAESNTYEAVLNGRSMSYFALDVLPDIERGFHKGDFSIARDFLQQILERIKKNKEFFENMRSSVRNVEGLTGETHTMISRKMGQLEREASNVGSDWSLSGKIALSATGAVILAATTGSLGWMAVGVGAAGGMWYASLDDSTRENVRQLLRNDLDKLTEISEKLKNAKESLDSVEKDITALIHVLSDTKDYSEDLHCYLFPSYRVTSTFRQRLESIAKMYKDAYDTFNDAIDKYRGASI